MDDPAKKPVSAAVGPAPLEPGASGHDRISIVHDLAETGAWLDALQDPEQGFVGAAFKKATEALGTSENIDLETPYNAVFRSFMHDPDQGGPTFINGVTYGRQALSFKEKLFAARVHEFVHALQYDRAAAMHADPFNDASDIVLCPEDYIMRKERLEQDAYVKGAWLCSLALADFPRIREAMAGFPLPVTIFEDARAQSASLQETFNRAAAATRNARGVWWTNGVQAPVADDWHFRCLEEYKEIIDDRLKEGRKITYVRLEKDDVLEIGNSLGPNTFAGMKDILKLESLSAQNAETLAALNLKLGITDKDRLPSLQEALAVKSQTPQEFIRASKAHVVIKPAA